ncbi:MAG: serine/threonine protein phosphatase [Acidobacteria bacterium]|nr:MAG: serine/threonine protein phosphatase [Acidobacteriota bacterium]
MPTRTLQGASPGIGIDMPETAKVTARPLEPTELLTLLVEATEQLNSTLDLDEVMSHIAAIVKRAIDYDVFAILLLNEKTQELRVRFSLGHPEDRVRNLRVKVGEGIVGRAAKLRRSVLVNDVRQDSGYIESLPAVRSELAVPLIAKGRLIGIMDLEASAADFFTDQHKTLLELLAARTAMSLENARLYRRTLRQARTLQLLNEISREFSSVLVLNELLGKIGTLTKRVIDYHRFCILLADEKTQTFNAVISLKKDERMPEKCNVAFGEGIVGAAASLRETVVAPDVSKDPRYIMVNPETRSEMAVPLLYHDRVIGVVDLESPHAGSFTDEHVRVLSTLAPQIAIAIENARLYEQVAKSEGRMERDLQRAREIQVHLLPPLSPRIPGLEVGGRFLPARELGGDLYDFLTYGKDRHVLAIGDVSGKGSPAALYGAMAIGVLRSLAAQRLSPAEMLRRLNLTFLERQVEGHFITLLYVVWEPKTRTLRVANAGMPLPILVRDGQSRPLRAEGVPLGLLGPAEYQETTATLKPGDLLVMYTDGLAEAAGKEHEEFGLARLQKVLHSSAGRPVADIVDAIYSEVARFEAGYPRRDDQTLLLGRVR